MKKKSGIFGTKQLWVVVGAVLAILLAVSGMTFYTYRNSLKEFAGDGYVLVPPDKAVITTNVNEKYYFSKGTTYRKQLDEAVLFRDTTNNKVNIDTTQFVHYLDGSLASFTKGVVMELTGINQNQVTYYGISDKTTLVKNGMSYDMSYLGDSLQLQEFVWKIADDTYMMVAPQLTLYLTAGNSIIFEDYVQLQYVDGGIVRLMNEENTYQTISGEAFLKTDNGTELKLVDKMFYVNGQEMLSLNDMIIDSSENLVVDEDEETIKIPTFNVINGTDGASGEDGQTADSGDDGAIGDNGENGEDGGTGESGYDGGDGKKGYDGEAGDDGDGAYDGKNGASGENAENFASTDGIAPIEQEQIPSVRLATNSYQVTTNSILMNLNISDPAGLLAGDLTYYIYERNTMTEIATGEISRAFSTAAISCNYLLPGTEYLFLVQGSYNSGGVMYETDLFTKVFETESIGVTLSKVQTTSDSIKIKVELDEEIGITSYSIAIYDKDGNQLNANVPAANKLFTTSKEIEFKENVNLDNGLVISANSEYKIQLVNVTAADWSVLSSDISLDVKTLKTTPYYEEEQNNPLTGIRSSMRNPITNKQAVVATSSRYHTVSVSLDAGVCDPDNGITGYRYELYNATSNELVGSKEISGLKTVSFDVSNETEAVPFYGKVVILFNDNEKIVEIASAKSNVETLEKIDYPKVSVIVEDGSENNHAVGVHYDRIAGYIYVEDVQGYLLPNINATYPMLLEFQSDSGASFTISKDDTSIEWSPNRDSAKIYFDQSELLQNTTYTITVLGPLNTSETQWSQLPTASKNSMAATYLGGLTVTTPSPTMSMVNYSYASPTDGNCFAVEFSLSEMNASSSAYEVANTEQLTFSLYNADTGDLIGTYNWKDTKDGDYHASDLSQHYAPAAQDARPIILQDYDFTKMTGDSRVSGGGTFRIVLENGYDYTYQEALRTEHGYYNEMKYSTLASGEAIPTIGTNPGMQECSGSTAVEFYISPSHTAVTRPNQAVTISFIKNGTVMSGYQAAGVEDDTVAAVRVVPSYTWTDATSITYYIYRMDRQDELHAVLGDDETIYQKYANEYTPYAKKTIACGYTANGETYGGMISPWIAYLNDTAGTGATNLDDNGNVIFERGYQYFVRYEVTCSGSLGDGITNYPGDLNSYSFIDGNGDEITGALAVPFYRCSVFTLEKQSPKIYRYLDSTQMNGSKAVYSWKYKIQDVDGAIANLTTPDGEHIAYNLTADTYETIQNYDEGMLGYGVDAGRGAYVTNLPSGSNSYTGNFFYAADCGINIDDLLIGVSDFINVQVPVEDKKFYRIAIPYISYKDGKADKVEFQVSEPLQSKQLFTLNTSIRPQNESMTGEYKVNGVMVKGVDTAIAGGFKDEAGYQLHITLQGDESIFRITALRVTLTEEGAASPKVLVYDPVLIDVKNSTVGNANNANYVADAYLAYAPIAQMMPNTRVKVTISAYYATGNLGYQSYSQVANNLLDPNTNKITTDDSKVWAIKKFDYEDGYNEAYQYLSEGAVKESGNIRIGENVYMVAKNSVIVPYLDRTQGAENIASGLVAVDDSTIHMYAAYANGSICENQSNATGNYMFRLALDRSGTRRMSGEDEGDYMVVEQLSLAPLQMDVAGGGDHKEYTYTTGSGMPGITYNSASSTMGVGSASIRFNTKGNVSNKLEDNVTLDGLYLFLYDLNGRAISLKKYQDSNGACYYMVSDKAATDPANDKLVAVSTANNPGEMFTKNFAITNGSDFNSAAYKSYATKIEQDRYSTNGAVVFNIRGLERSTKYFLRVMAKDNSGNLSDLYDYGTFVIGDTYNFTTADMIDMEFTNAHGMVYEKYDKQHYAVPFIIAGSEGYNMRIYYRIYDTNNQEVRLTTTDCSTEGIGSYVSSGGKDIGYLIPPIGTSVHYYSGEAGQNNDAKLPLLLSGAGGILTPGATYKVVLNAYSSDNSGANVDFSVPIGTIEKEITLPATKVSSEIVTLRATAQETSVTASWTIKNKEHSIINDQYTLYVYKSDENRNDGVREVFTLPASVPTSVKTSTITGLSPQTEYIMELVADVDTNYDGTQDLPLSKKIRFTTSASASTTHYGTVQNGKLVLNLADLTNFSSVVKVTYTVYSPDGQIAYGSGYQDVTEDNRNSNSIVIPTNISVNPNLQYRYQLQYFDGSEALLGSDDGMFQN